MTRWSISVLTVCVGLAAMGCREGIAPTVTIVEVSPDTLDPTRDDADDLRIVVEYRDGDGDLGSGVADIHDCRAAGLVTALAIPPIASEEAVAQGVPIEGTLVLQVNDVGDAAIADAAPAVCAELSVGRPVAGEAVFCVVLIDSSGHAGPGDCTAAIAIASSA